MTSAIAEARVPTEVARRYMNQLCKHFQHRLPVVLGETEGQITFPTGLCRLTATGQALLLRAEATDAASLPALQDVVARHLARFAFREAPEIGWESVFG